MKLIRGINNLRQKFKRPVLTIGIFDGMHLAHQRIIKEVVRQAKILEGTSIVLTFNPHPLKIHKGPAASPLISSLEHRIGLIRHSGTDICLVADFDKRFSKIYAQNFVKQILVDTIGVDYVIVGEGFRFGKDRGGSFFLLKKLSKIYGFNLRKIASIKMDGQTVSSSRIRSLIQKGKIVEANRLLGRAFSIQGEVKKGVARGRILGYPTANIAPHKELIPLAGVYAVGVKLGNKILSGVLNIGCRPTFHPKRKFPDTIEVHIFNFHKKIYGQTLKVFFIQRIRPEKKFASRQALFGQIKKDELKAKKILKSIRTLPQIYPVRNPHRRCGRRLWRFISNGA